MSCAFTSTTKPPEVSAPTYSDVITGRPAKVPPHSGLPLIGPLLEMTWVHFAFSWFAFLFDVTIIGCFQGFRTHGGADSVGRQTTRSVVQSIFLVIVADALFSIAFSALDL